MKMRVVESLSALLITLAPYPVDSMPHDYINWPIKSTLMTTKTYRSSDKPNAEVVREILRFLIPSYSKDIINFRIIGHSKEPNISEPGKSKLEIDARIDGSESTKREILERYLRSYAKFECGQCHPIIEK